ncbi:Sulfotransferase 6B1, partial [Ophiophagus hannah]
MAQKQLSKFLDEKLEENKRATPSERTFMYDGVLYPTMICCPETLKRVHTFRAREDDIILQLLMHLEVASGKYEEDEQKQSDVFDCLNSAIFFLEFGEPEKFERMEKLPSRRIIKTHLSPQKLPKSIFEQKAKILVLLRNPKDTAVSFFHFSKGIKMISDQETWDEYFEAFITGKASSLKKIAKFFDFSVTEEKIESIVKETRFESMKDNAGTYGKVGQVLFRKGIVGDWTSLFSESQNEKMDRKFEETVAKTKLGMKLKYEHQPVAIDHRI